MGELVMLLVVFLILAVLYVAAIWLVRRFVKHQVREGHNDVLVPLFLMAGTLYAVLLAFLVIAVWEAHDAASNNVAEEASTLATMYRQTAGMPAAEQAKLRAAIREYTEAVIKDEWPIQAATGGASPKARHGIVQMYREIGTLPPNEANSPITQEFLRTYSTVAADRNRRTLQANEELPFVLWFALLLGACIVVGMSFFLYMDVQWPHILMSGVMALLIFMLLGITFVLDQPFKGINPLAPEPFEHSMGVYDSVDKDVNAP